MTTNPPDELVLKVARAIHTAHNDPELYAWWHTDPDYCQHSRGLARAAIAAMPELSALQDKIRRLEEALKKIAKPGVGAAFDWSVEECERYWAQQTERCRSLARTALSHDGGGV